MDPTDRFLAYIIGQAALLGVLAGLTGGLTMVTPLGWTHTYLAVKASGPVAGLVHQFGWVFWTVPALLFVLAPLAIVGGAALTDHELGLAGTSYTVGALLPVFLVGVVAGSFLAAPADPLVEQRSIGAPHAAFAVDYAERGDGRGILTVTHDGGELLQIGRLNIEGDGIADIPGADQTESGTWRGEATAEWNGEPAVQPGDAVTVGVKGECVVRVVYRTEWSSVTLTKHTCSGSAAE